MYWIQQIIIKIYGLCVLHNVAATNVKHMYQFCFFFFCQASRVTESYIQCRRVIESFDGMFSLLCMNYRLPPIWLKSPKCCSATSGLECLSLFFSLSIYSISFSVTQTVSCKIFACFHTQEHPVALPCCVCPIWNHTPLQGTTSF